MEYRSALGDQTCPRLNDCVIARLLGANVGSWLFRDVPKGERAGPLNPQLQTLEIECLLQCEFRPVSPQQQTCSMGPQRVAC